MKDSTLEKHKRVIDAWFVNGRNGTKAYMSVYPDANTENAKVRFSEIVTNSNISDYITEKETTISAKLNITLESILQDLEDAKQIGKDMQDAPVIIKASEAQAKLLGFYSKDNEQKKAVFQLPKIEIIYPKE
jgi:hypothetical protein